MKVSCVCGKWHDVSPTALALIVDAFISGDLQTVSQFEVSTLCIGVAFTDARVDSFAHRYQGSVITFDKRRGDVRNVNYDPLGGNSMANEQDKSQQQTGGKHSGAGTGKANQEAGKHSTSGDKQGKHHRTDGK